MSDYLLDTNILSDLIKDQSGKAAQRVREVGADAVATSIFCASELIFGAEKKGSDKLTARVAQLLSMMNIIDYEQPMMSTYAKVRTRLERAGTPISDMDMLIATQALYTDRVMVSGNVREFERVEGLSIEDWRS